MAVARVLDLLLATVYRGRFRRFATDHELNRRLRAMYWGVYRAVAEDERTVRVGEATATFSVSTYAEYHVVNAVEREERPVVERVIEELDRDDVFWDIGANVGTFSCLAGDVLEAGTVVAFEPYPPNAEKLRRNLANNDVRAVVKPCALSRTPGGRTLFVHDTEEAGTLQGSIVSAFASDEHTVGSIDVDVTTGDRLVTDGDVPAPTVVKMDVEGAAPDVLDGMVGTIRHPACRLVVVEPHDNSDAIERRLLDAGFDVDEVRLARERRGESPTMIASAPDGAAAERGPSASRRQRGAVRS